MTQGISPIRSENLARRFEQILKRIKELEPDAIHKIVERILASNKNEQAESHVGEVTRVESQTSSTNEIADVATAIGESSELQKLVTDVDTATMEVFSQLSHVDLSETLNSRVSEAGDAIGVIRNVWQADKGTKVKALVHMGIASGFLSVASGYFLIKSGIEIQEESQKIGDIEGKKDGSLRVSLGLLLTLQGIITVATKIAALFKTAALTIAGTISYYVLSPLFVLATASFGGFALKTASGFRKEWREILDGDGDKKEKIEKATLYLYHSLSLSSKEVEEIEEQLQAEKSSLSPEKYEEQLQAEKSSLSPEKYEERLQAEKKKGLEVKQARLKRRIGGKAFNHLEENLKGLIENIGQDSFDIDKAETLIKEVSKGNLQQITVGAACIVLSLISLAVIILMLVYGSPVSVFLLMAISSFIWLSMDSNFLNQKLFADLPWFLRQKIYTESFA